jgi:Zn-finger nucleic acid-binding protein
MQSSYDCPRCKVALTVGRAGDFAAHACGVCGGMWLENDALELLSKAVPDSPASVRALKLAKSISSGAVQEADTAPDELPCPQCRQPMLRARMHDAWLDVDICHEHGTWFDCGEVERFAQSLKQQAPADWRSTPPPARIVPVAGSTPAAASGTDPGRGFANLLRAVAGKLENAAIEWSEDR